MSIFQGDKQETTRRDVFFPGNRRNLRRIQTQSNPSCPALSLGTNKKIIIIMPRRINPRRFSFATLLRRIDNKTFRVYASITFRYYVFPL